MQQSLENKFETAPPPPPPLLSIRLEVHMILYKLDKKSRSVPSSLGVNYLL